ncbi:MAG: hypothetical protein J6C85_05250 [Alphaproteobacteria bacterium]|nr:hypothetical protein [Alphaproteobacteria bacterium]
MKTKIFILAVVILTIAACQKAEKEKPLSKTLSAFTIKTDDGKILTGVKNTKTNQTIIEPIEASSAEIDGRVITITDLHKHKHAYTLEGIKLGSFENWTHWQTEDIDYYHGTNYNKNCYYFPDKKFLCKAISAYAGTKALLLEQSSCWETIDYHGNVLFTLNQPFWIVKSLQGKEGERIFVVTPKGKSAYIVRHFDGKIQKKLSKSAWQNLKKSFVNLKKMSKLAMYAETDQL